MISNLNKKLADLIGEEVNYTEEININNDENYSLAEMYASKGFRSYLEKKINMAVRSAAVMPETEVEMAAFKSKVITLKSLLDSAKKAYLGIEALRKKANADNSKGKENFGSNEEAVRL